MQGPRECLPLLWSSIVPETTARAPWQRWLSTRRIHGGFLKGSVCGARGVGHLLQGGRHDVVGLRPEACRCQVHQGASPVVARLEGCVRRGLLRNGGKGGRGCWSGAHSICFHKGNCRARGRHRPRGRIGIYWAIKGAELYTPTSSGTCEGPSSGLEGLLCVEAAICGHRQGGASCTMVGCHRHWHESDARAVDDATPLGIDDVARHWVQRHWPGPGSRVFLLVVRRQFACCVRAPRVVRVVRERVHGRARALDLRTGHLVSIACCPRGWSSCTRRTSA